MRVGELTPPLRDPGPVWYSLEVRHYSVSPGRSLSFPLPSGGNDVTAELDNFDSRQRIAMSVDTYAVCPCGNGKKIKFCLKCKDSVGELDRVLKMVDGGQVVPALDRLAAILQEYPNAAWALAIRGRLLLDLREYESLSDNADRFIRLQPSNPLALTQRAAAQLVQNDVSAATESLLEALTESGRDVDTFVLDVAAALAMALAQQGHYLTARVYASLVLFATDYEGNQPAGAILRQLNSSPTVNHLLKDDPAKIARPADVDWAERYDEAAALLRSNKVVLAQSKFESLQRSLSGEPAVLSGLLTCAVWRGDADAQSRLLKKLAECESLDFEQRVRLRALSALVVPREPELAVETFDLRADLDNPDEVEMALTADSRIIALPPELLGSIPVDENDVPPKAGFQILDRDKPESTDQLPPVGEVPEGIGMIFLFGRQTDRAARIEVNDVRPSNLEGVRDRIGDVIGGAEKLEQQGGESLPLFSAAHPQIALLRYQAKPSESDLLQRELVAQRMPNAIVDAPLPILSGKTLRELAADATKLLERTAVIRVIENYDAIAAKGSEILSEARRLAGLDALPPLTPTAEEVETVSNADLNRVDPTGLDASALLYLLQRAQQISATPAIRRFSDLLVAAEVTDEQRPAKMLAYVARVNAAEGSEAALERLEEAKSFAEANGLSIANLLLSEVSLRLQAGDADGFQVAIQQLSTRHGNDPEIMAQLQQMLMAYGLISPDGTPRRAGPTPPAGQGSPLSAPPQQASGGLWTPDSGAPPQKPAEGGGKLWVPGMD